MGNATPRPAPCFPNGVRFPLPLLLVCLLVPAARLRAQAAAAAPAASPNPFGQPLQPLREVPFAALSATALGRLGQAALAVRPTEWKHAETSNFVLHFFHHEVAGPVSVEAEFYYRVVAKDLGKENARWERKSHIFIFENPEDWSLFRNAGGLDPWTGGLHSRGELFIQRDPSYRWQGHSLGHEITHLVVHRFFGGDVPLWLNEGYAEYASRIAYATFHRARGRNARPRFSSADGGSGDPNALLPIKDLTERVAYPADVAVVRVFYAESQCLVRFLAADDKVKFLGMFEMLAHGSLFEAALRLNYGSRFVPLPALEAEFRRKALAEIEE